MVNSSLAHVIPNVPESFYSAWKVKESLFKFAALLNGELYDDAAVRNRCIYMDIKAPASS